MNQANLHDEIDVSQYLSPFKPSRVRLILSSYWLKRLMDSLPGKESVSILLSVLKLVAGRDGQMWFGHLLRDYDQTPQHESAKMYESADSVAEEAIQKELIAEVRKTIEVNKGEAIGYLYDDAKDKVTFNANVFVEHFMTRCDVRVKKDGHMFLYNYKKGVYEELSEVELGKIIRTLMHEGLPNSWKGTAESEVVRALQREAPLVDEMNINRNFINLKNGMLSLDTYELLPHDPKYLSTVQIPITYDPKEQAPNFMKFMRQITLEDDELICVMQEIIGYLLTSETKAEKAFFFYGSGANGKSVLANVITALIGKENVSSVPLSEFGQQFGLESLINKSVNISAENEMGGKSLKTDSFKSIVSGDIITINIKYRAAIAYRPFCRLVFLGNNLPDSMDVTNGYFRKLVIIPFRRTFQPAERDVNLTTTLLEELPGILNWAKEGLKRLRTNQYQFSHSQVIEQCHQSYYIEQNPVKEFFLEHVVVEAGTRTRQAEFHDKYLRWLSMQGIDDKGTRSKQVFWRYFKIVLENENVSICKKKVKGTTYFDGLSIVGLDELNIPSLPIS